MATPTPPPPPTPPQILSDEVGNRVYEWHDGARVVCELPRKQKSSGKYPATVSYKGEPVTSGDVNLNNLQDRERLAAHCQAQDGAVLWLPRFSQIGSDLSTLQGPQRTVDAIQLSTVTPVRVDFWWKPYLPKGRIVGLVGDPGAGKSTLVIKIAAHLTSGTAFPNLYDYTPMPSNITPQNVCLLTAEDDPADTILPRLLVNGGDAARVHLITGWSQTDGSHGVVTMQDLDLLRQALDTYKPALLVFDPIQSFFGPRIDMNHANDTRPVLDAITALCKPYGCTTLYVCHIGKTVREKALYAGLGSIDIAANMRSVLFLGKDPDNEERRVVAQSKASNAPEGSSLAFLMTNVEHTIATDAGLVTVEAPRVDWDGRSTLTANDLSAPAPQDKEEDDTSARDAATAFLTEVLKDGPVIVKEVKKAARENGIAWRTIERAKSRTVVRARKREVAGKNAREWPWEWHLSTEEEDARWES